MNVYKPSLPGPFERGLVNCPLCGFQCPYGDAEAVVLTHALSTLEEKLLDDMQSLVGEISARSA